MKKLLFGVIATVMISGLFLGSIGNSAFADVAEDNPADPAVCNKENHKGNAKNKNPHCVTGGSEPIPSSSCDIDSNGSITSTELGVDPSFIIGVENTTIGETDNNGEINTLDEFNRLLIFHPECAP